MKWIVGIVIALALAAAANAVPTTSQMAPVAEAAPSGGPDSFGYTFIDSNVPGGPTYDWVEISTIGTEVLSDSDDQWVDEIDIGFFFNYYGTDYSQLAISNNGLLFSGGATSQYVNEPITQSPSVHGFIAAFWDDLVTWNPTGRIYYQTLGTSPNRMFVVEWADNQHYQHSDSGVTFEAILYEGSNNIKLQYNDVDFGLVSGAVPGDDPPYDNGGSATVGIEDPSGSVGLQYSFNEEAIAPRLAIRFEFPQFVGTNLFLSKQAPPSKNRGTTITYALYYHNFGSAAAENVALEDNLPADVDFVSASGDGTYDSNTRKVTWNIGSLEPLAHGYTTVTVRIPQTVPTDTVIENGASISTSDLEVRYDDNEAYAQTRVTGPSLPSGVSVEPNNGGTTPSVYWRTPVTFSYSSCPTVTGVEITIGLTDGGPDIAGSMTEGPPEWTYTTTFYPRTGRATVAYSIQDPAPYSADFDVRTLFRFEKTITADDIEAYIRSRQPASPMLEEEGIGERILRTGLDNNVNPAFLVATAEHEGQFGTAGWAATHPDSHNTMGWGIPSGDTPPNDINSADSWGEMVERVAYYIAHGDYYYAQERYTVREIRDAYAGQPATQTVVSYMGQLAESAGQAGEFDEDFNIYIDPAGYIYDAQTGERIAGASVWLQRPDGTGDWESVPTGETPPIAQPDVNPLITGEDGQYQWDVLEGSYRVHIEASGYYPADSVVVSIPPPVTDLHVGLTPIGDTTPPTTTISLDPATPDGANGWYVSPVNVTLAAEDDLGGSGVASTEYRLDGGSWQPYVGPFTLSTDGTTTIDARSTDNAANVEDPPASATVYIDQIAPGVNIEVPTEGVAVQDGVTLAASDSDATSGVADVRLYVREDDGGSGIDVGFEGLPATYNSGTGYWEHWIDTTVLPDGYYVALAKAEDTAGNEGWSDVRHFSIRNWAVLELLPASESNKAGRTMPIKFSLRIAAAVDPAQPFVYNEDLTIKIYETAYPADVLQTSTYGDTARDYRIDQAGEKYITNFKTLRRPKNYMVEIWRQNFLDFLVGDFTFSTVK